MDKRISTDVFVIPLLDRRYLVYAPLRRTAFITNAAMVELLDCLKHNNLNSIGEDENKYINFLKEIRLLGKEGDFPISTYRHASFKPTEATLFLTTRCNLRCIYCYAMSGDQPLIDMSLKTAKAGIEFVCRNSLELGRKDFFVGYHGGGEPTVNWDVLTDSFEYAKKIARNNGLEVIGSIATNGILSQKQLEWIVKNLDGVNLSIDGLQSIQDLQRPKLSGRPSFPDIMRTVEFFDRVNYGYGIRVTVTKASINQLPESITFLLEKTKPGQIQIEPVYKLGRGSKTGLEVDPEEFIAAFRKAKAIANAAGLKLFYSGARLDTLTNRFCIGCGEGFSLTPRGLVSACYEVPGEEFPFAEEFIFGRYDSELECFSFDFDKINLLRNKTVEQIDWCRDCFCKWHCAGDCAYKKRHNAINGEFYGDARCEITRALTVDQILDKLSSNGGVFWAENLQRKF